MWHTLLHRLLHCLLHGLHHLQTKIEVLSLLVLMEGLMWPRDGLARTHGASSNSL